MYPKPSKQWYFREKIGGSTEKKHIFAQKKKHKKALFRKLQEKKATSVKKKHMCFSKALCTTPVINTHKMTNMANNFFQGDEELVYPAHTIQLRED